MNLAKFLRTPFLKNTYGTASGSVLTMLEGLEKERRFLVEFSEKV